mgnify:CR=1 FL=1
MSKTRTTIILPTTLFKELKHHAIEQNTSISAYIAETLLKNLRYSLPDIAEEKARDVAKIESLAGRLNMKVNDSPEELKKLILKRYDEEVLS